MKHKYGCECEECLKLRKEVSGYIQELVESGKFEYGNDSITGKLTIKRGKNFERS